jgi:hypothetical protein
MSAWYHGVQVKLQDMYNKYHEEQPDARTMAIPTAVVSPGDRYALQLLRYQKSHHDAHLDASQVDDAMKSLWQGLRTVQQITAKSNLPSDIFGALSLFPSPSSGVTDVSTFIFSFQR